MKNDFELLVNKVCKAIPSNWIITVNLENDSAWINIDTPDGEVIMVENDKGLYESL